MAEIGKALITMRSMVDSFISVHDLQYSKKEDEYFKEHGFHDGPQSLSLQSYIGSDLTIDMAYLAKDIETRGDFTNEYWIRSQGIQCIRSEEDRKNNKMWRNILGKFSVTKKGEDITFAWIQDEDCKLQNSLLKDGKLFVSWY